MNKEYIDKEWQLLGVYKKEGIFRREDGKDIPYKVYYIEIQEPYTGVIMRGKIDKVFNDYVEDRDTRE